MKIFLAIIAFFAFSGVISATIVDASCSHEANEVKYQVNGSLKSEGDKATISILNYQELEDVVAESSDSTILSVEGPNEDGIVTVTALVNEKTANVIITAKDTQKAVIPFSITNKVEIIVTVDNDSLWPGESTTLRIQNIKELINPKVINDTPDWIQVTEIDYDQGTALVTALNTQLVLCIISITADNAPIPGEVFLSTKWLKTIDARSDLPYIVVGASTNITIYNFDDLSNLQIFPDSEGILEIGEIDDQGKVLITGIKGGQTIIKMTADHANTLSLPFLVIG